MPVNVLESPPDSSSEHLLSPHSAGASGSLSPPTAPNTTTTIDIGQHLHDQQQGLELQGHQGQQGQGHEGFCSGLPDLSAIDYSVPLQLIEHQSDQQQQQQQQDGLQEAHQADSKKSMQVVS